MLKINLWRIMFLSALLFKGGFWISIASAGDLSITFLDQNGENVENAVVMLYPLDGQEILTTPPYSPMMAQRDMAFLPHVLPVFKGSSVTFPNQDETRHHVYSFSQAKTFELRLYDGEEERSVEFDDVGVVVLGCNIHDSMLGYIYVSDTPLFLRSGLDGLTHFENLAEGQYRIRIWHPRMRGKEDKTEQILAIAKDGVHNITKNLRLRRERKNRAPY